MFIQQTRIRSLKGRLSSVKKGATIIVGAKLVPDMMPRLQRIGFPSDANIGDSILPADIGPITGFNAHGANIVHKD